MKVTRILASMALLGCFAGTALAQPCARLTWGNVCTPNPNQNYAGPAIYQLTMVMEGVGGIPNVGTESNIHLSPAVADAWGYNSDGGCQDVSASNTFTTDNAAVSGGKSGTCPAMKGNNSLTIVSYALDGAGEANINLTITYDTFTPTALPQTLWRVFFNHQLYSSVGPSDPAHCGGVEKCVNFSITPPAGYARLLLATGQAQVVGPCDVIPGNPGAQATWNGGCPPVATEPATWGKVKGLYR